MNKRLLKTSLLTSIVYAFPLIGKPELILSFKLLIPALSCIILLLSQPDFSTSDAKANHSKDKWTVFGILSTCGVCFLIPVIEYGYFNSVVSKAVTTWTIVGFIMLVGGISFRIWSIRTLGKFFTATVQIVENHKIIKTGPYSIVRHPSYTGAFFAIVGSAIFLESLIGTIASILLMALIYHLRITTEEETLISEFGDEYKNYQSLSKKLIPYIY